MRKWPLATGLLLVAAALLGGCAGNDTAAGCTPPAHESELLDAYEADPVFDVRPPEARNVRQPTRSVACRVDPDWPNDPTQAAVDLQMETAVAYDVKALHTMYDQVATSHGWQQMPAQAQETLRYCRHVRDVTSYLSISAASPRPQVGVRGPDAATPSVSPRAIALFHYLRVRIAAAPDQPNCPAGG